LSRTHRVSAPGSRPQCRGSWPETAPNSEPASQRRTPPSRLSRARSPGPAAPSRREPMASIFSAAGRPMLDAQHASGNGPARPAVSPPCAGCQPIRRARGTAGRAWRPPRRRRQARHSNEQGRQLDPAWVAISKAHTRRRAHRPCRGSRTGGPREEDQQHGLTRSSAIGRATKTSLWTTAQRVEALPTEGKFHVLPEAPCARRCAITRLP